MQASQAFEHARDRVAAGHGFDYATGVDVRVDRHPVLAAEFNTDSVFGAGDVVSTARDLFRFDQALKAGRILSTSSQADAYTSLILPEGFPAGYGLGWQVAESEYTGRIIHHQGRATATGPATTGSSTGGSRS